MKKINYLLIVVTLLFLSSCSSLQINQANQALSNHFNAKANAIANDNFMLAASMRAALQDLARETKLAAEKESDVLNKIAFYQISATAAWQSNTLLVSEYAKDGQALCDQANNAEQMPVHCSMLLFTPIFSINDTHQLRTKDLEAKIESARSMDDKSIMENLEIEAQAMVDGLLTAVKAAAVARKKISSYQKLSDDAIEQIDKNLHTLACENLEATVAIFANDWNDYDNSMQARKAIKKLGTTMDLTCAKERA